MQYIEQSIKGVWVIEPLVFGDQRGYFCETYKKTEFDKNIGSVEFIQDNESKSSYGVFRGLHFQKGEFSQAKLVRCIKGTVIDIAVDLRVSSATFGKHICVELSDENHRQLYIPRGFAHGFIVKSEEAIFCYKVDNIYSPDAECCIRFDDSFIGLHLDINPNDLKLSEKDLYGLSFQEAPKFE